MKELYNLLQKLQNEGKIEYFEDEGEIRIIPKDRRLNGKFCNDVICLYNRILPELPKVIKLTEKRKHHILARAKEYKDMRDLKGWEEYFELIKECDFLIGRNNRGWRANFDWLILPNNMVKVKEGFYLRKSNKNLLKKMLGNGRLEG